MSIQKSKSEYGFTIINTIFLSVLGLLSLLPMIHILAVSFSSTSAAAAGAVYLWPVDFTMGAYKYSLEKPLFVGSFAISSLRVVVGVLISMFLTVITAYPLSKESAQFRWRTWYAWFAIITILFSGGLIPNYMVIRQLGLMDTIWALVLPQSVNVFNVMLMLHFIRGLPKELSESAYMDGAGHWRTLWSIILPLCKPVLATLFLFVCVYHWNSWFDGLIYMNKQEHYPLQTYLQTMMVSVEMNQILSKEEMEAMSKLSDRTVKSAQIFLAMLPILILYPMLQKYFVKGIVLGSVKE